MMIDTIIIGGGPSGLCAAKTILQCEPSTDLKILDAHSTIGGVWCKEKLYPLLKTNHFFGGLDFSDFPMQESSGGRPGQHVQGTAVHDFLCQYAHRWRVEDKIQFNTKVTEVTRLDDDRGWELKTVHQGEGEQIQRCRKLIVAIGVNNAPHKPHIEGSADFGAPILHSSEVGSRADELLSDPFNQTIAVLGGGKSAYDAVYYAAASGKQVEWIIRKSGKGPTWVFPLLTKLGPFEVQKDRLPVRRIISFFSPCIWNDGFGWIRNLIHGTAVGKFIAQKFWRQMHMDTIRDCGYREDEKLKVHCPFWYGTTGGSYSYEPALFDFIKSGRVRVRREDIAHLSERTIHMAGGETLSVDALILATGFSARPTIQFNPPSIHSDLGIPTVNLDTEQEEFWRKLDVKSDEAIYQRYPRLLGGPFENPKSETVLPYNPGMDAETNYSPFRLFRSIAPPGLTARGDRSLVFLGVFSNFANHARLEIQCLWAYAYLNNRLPIDQRQSFQEASMMSRYSKHRTPFGHGRFFPDHVFDQLPYFDTLLQDLGLSPWRKSNNLRELFEPYTAADYQGIVQEWMDRNLKK